MITHNIDVGECKVIKQHLYCVNPHKCHVMKTEVDYKVNVCGAHYVCLNLNQMIHGVFSLK